MYYVNPRSKKPKRKRKLAGAALMSRKKRLAKAKRKRKSVKRRVRKNPTKKRNVMAKRKRKSTRKSAKRVAAGRKAARTRKSRKAKRSASAKKSRRKVRKNPARKRRVVRRRKRRAAPRKRRVVRRRRKNPSRKRVVRRRKRRNPAPRGKAARKAWRKRPKSKRRYVRRRVSVKRYKAKRRVRTNPGGGRGLVGKIKNVLKQVVPAAAAFLGARVAANAVAGMLVTVPKPEAVKGFVADHSKPIAAVALVVAAWFAGSKIKALRKYQSALVVGAGVAAVHTLVEAYAPTNIKGILGVSEYVDLGEYIDMGDYAEAGDYIDVGDYAEMGALEELGVEEDLGACPSPSGLARRLQIGTGIGSKYGMLKPIPQRSMLAQIPQVSMLREVPAWEAQDESELYTGVFAHPTMYAHHN